MLIQEVRDHLTGCIIPFWKSLRDDTYGGYYGEVGYDLNRSKKAVKGGILNSRILWFFSNAYAILGEESLLDEAAHAYEFMKRSFIDQEYGGVYWSVNYDGSVCDDTKHTYNQAFALYALFSYYEISKDADVLLEAMKLYNLIDSKCTDNRGFLEAFNRKFVPIDNKKLSENGIVAEKTMNTLLHVFEAYTEMYRVTKEERVGERLRLIMDIFVEKVYNPILKRQEVFFDAEMNSIIDLHSYGHDIETTWLMDRGCEILDDQTYTDKMQIITKELMSKVYERAYRDNSLLNECENGIDDTNRIWWVQAESVVGFLNAYEKDPAKAQYLQAANNIWEYIKTYIIDSRPGSEWFWMVDDKGVQVGEHPIVEPWKCPYHNGRMCIEIIRRQIDAAW